jgi:predicted choloylglycine hydrolase
MNKLTWKELLVFLLQEKQAGRLVEDNHVMIHNIETGDEHYCDTIVLDNTNRLVLAMNYED